MKKELTLKSQTLFNIQATMELSCKKNSIVYYFQSLIIIIHDRACSNKISNSNWTELNSGTRVFTPCLHSNPLKRNLWKLAYWSSNIVLTALVNFNLWLSTRIVISEWLIKSPWVYSWIKPRSLVLQVDFLPSELPVKPKDTGFDSLSLLQGILLIQELNQGLLHCRQICYQLNYQGSPILWYKHNWITWFFFFLSGNCRNKVK